MGMRVTELSCKEVVCIRDGARLGYVADVEVEVPEGQVCAIVEYICIISSRDHNEFLRRKPCLLNLPLKE